MHSACAACGLAYEREPGYFLVAMYLSYFLQFVILIPLYAILLASGWTYPATMGLLFGLVVLASPLVFRLSRWVWIWVGLRVP